MRKLFLAVFVAIMIVAGACSSTKNLGTQTQDAESAYNAGNYQKALANWEEVIKSYEDDDRQKECPVYGKAALAAIQLGQTEKAIDYLKKDAYSNYASAETFFELSKLYRDIDNLSKELEALDTYQNNYPTGNHISAVKSRLFEIYVDTENWDKAKEIWPAILPEAANNESLLEGYFVTNKALKNDSVCNILADELLELNENNLSGLDWEAKKYFWQAENLYKDEMAAYEKNKTNRQYNKLLKSLDVVSADFKTSLGYFKTLYELALSPKYAKYLGNIYNRLDDKAKADYYYNKAGE